jgi:hypothetical protein
VSKLTVFFDAPFWVGVYERFTGGQLEVCKITFGTEPKDYEVYQFLLQNWSKLRFSPSLETEMKQTENINPKRMQRAIKKQTMPSGIGTKSQQALKLQHEQDKQFRKSTVVSKGKMKRNDSLNCVDKSGKRSIGAGNCSVFLFMLQRIFILSPGY